jgi:hypothetical protein
VIVDKGVLFIKDYDRKKMPLLTKFFEERRANPVCKGLDFCSFLTSPVKRMSEFCLFVCLFVCWLFVCLSVCLFLSLPVSLFGCLIS